VKTAKHVAGILSSDRSITVVFSHHSLLGKSDGAPLTEALDTEGNKNTTRLSVKTENL